MTKLNMTDEDLRNLSQEEAKDLYRNMKEAVDRKERMEDMHDVMWSAQNGWDVPFDRKAPWGLFEWGVMIVVVYFMIQTALTDGIF